MPPRSSFVIDYNSFIGHLIRKFDSLNRRFIIANTSLTNWPIIYCNDKFIALVGWTRSEVMTRSVICQFLHGSATDDILIDSFKTAIVEKREFQFDIVFVKKNNTEFLCNVIMAPIQHSNLIIVMFDPVFDDPTSTINASKLQTSQSSENTSLDKYANESQLQNLIYGTIERSQSLDINKACDSFSKSSSEKRSTKVAKTDISKRQLLSNPLVTFPTKQKAASMVDVTNINEHFKSYENQKSKSHKTTTKLIIKEMSKPHHNVGEKVAQVSHYTILININFNFF